MEGFIRDTENYCVSDAIKELTLGHEVFVYKRSVLEEIKCVFKDLIITKEEFYWSVINNDKSTIKRRKNKKR